MKRCLIIIFAVYFLFIPTLAQCAELSPKQVIEKYYGIMMNTCWGCGPNDLARSDSNMPLAKYIISGFDTNFSLDESLYPSLPLKISNCKIEKDKASCNVTYFTIGEWNGLDPFCEKHSKETATIKLTKDSGVWKISSRIASGERELKGDDSKVVSIPYILNYIDKIIKADREDLKTNDSQEQWRRFGVWKNKQEWLNRIKYEEKSFIKAKKAIKEINGKILKYGFKENKVYVKDFACN